MRFLDKYLCWYIQNSKRRQYAIAIAKLITDKYDYNDVVMSNKCTINFNDDS